MLADAMLAMVAVFLISGPIVVLYYSRKAKKMKVASVVEST